MVETKVIATIMEKGIVFVKSRVVIHKENSRAQDKVYDCGRVNVERYGDNQYIITFAPQSSSIGITSKGTISGRKYCKPKSLVVDEVRYDEYR